MTKLLRGFFFCAAALSAAAAAAQEPNYDEANVVSYTLPDPLVMSDGSPVATAEDWTAKRRPELLELFGREMYGVMPGVDRSRLAFETLRTDPVAFDGKATFKEVRIYFEAPNPAPKLDLLIAIPNKAEKPVPAFLLLNFQGNHTTDSDPWISISDNTEGNHTRGVNGEERRGYKKDRYPFEMIIDRGYALATAYYEDIDPDFDDQRQNGVHPLFAEFEKNVPEESRAATITAWAWGLSRALDCLETIPEIDAARVAVVGHSRLGKTSLWAGANDPRFAAVISNDSGCGGAALTRRNFGETIETINRTFPHWFCPKYKTYVGRTEELPIDQHELIALIAPRPVYVASASEDLWADPTGEYLSAYNADSVYRLLGTEGIGGAPAEPPEVDTPVGAVIHYHRRTGKHNLSEYDWAQYLDFADEYLPKKN
ncbi:MAG: acetylxylan esterase [Thermoguttaceae bacterium]|nr:acetylxylan esterase [Thermoguttaceae bacterium]